MTKALPKVRFNLVFHTQVAFGPLDLCQVHFKFLQNISIKCLNFNAYHPEGEDLENFQSKWKQSAGFFITTTLEVEDEEVELGETP